MYIPYIVYINIYNAYIINAARASSRFFMHSERVTLTWNSSRNISLNYYSMNFSLMPIFFAALFQSHFQSSFHLSQTQFHPMTSHSITNGEKSSDESGISYGLCIVCDIIKSKAMFRNDTHALAPIQLLYSS